MINYVIKFLTVGKVVTVIKLKLETLIMFAHLFVDLIGIAILAAIIYYSFIPY